MRQLTQETVKGKVDELLTRFKEENVEWDLLICGDTIVEFNGKIIEKPVEKITPAAEPEIKTVNVPQQTLVLTHPIRSGQQIYAHLWRRNKYYMLF